MADGAFDLMRIKNSASSNRPVETESADAQTMLDEAIAAHNTRIEIHGLVSRSELILKWKTVLSFWK